MTVHREIKAHRFLERKKEIRWGLEYKKTQPEYKTAAPYLDMRISASHLAPGTFST